MADEHSRQREALMSLMAEELPAEDKSETDVPFLRAVSAAETAASDGDEDCPHSVVIADEGQASRAVSGHGDVAPASYRFATALRARRGTCASTTPTRRTLGMVVSPTSCRFATARSSRRGTIASTTPTKRPPTATTLWIVGTVLRSTSARASMMRESRARRARGVRIGSARGERRVRRERSDVISLHRRGARMVASAFALRVKVDAIRLTPLRTHPAVGEARSGSPRESWPGDARQEAQRPRRRLGVRRRGGRFRAVGCWDGRSR